MNFTIAIVGDSAVGKTTFLDRHQSGRYTKQHNPTTFIARRNLGFYTTKGFVNLNMIEIPATTPFSYLARVFRDEGVDAVIVMFDLTQKITYKNALQYLKVCKANFPVVFVGNKCKQEKVVKTKTVLRSIGNTKYYHVSSRSCYNFEKPFLYLIQTLLLGDPAVNFVEAPAIVPAERVLDDIYSSN